MALPKLEPESEQALIAGQESDVASQLRTLQQAFAAHERGGRNPSRALELAVLAQAPQFTEADTDSPPLVWIEDTHGELRFGNRELRRVCREMSASGRTTKVMRMGAVDRTLWPESLQQTVRILYSSAVKSGCICQSFAFIGKPNDADPWLVSVFPLKLHGRSDLLGGVAVRASLSRLNIDWAVPSDSVLDTISSGIYRSTPNGKITMANQAFARMLGYDSAVELLQAGVFRPNHDANVEFALENGRNISDFERIWQTKSGTPLHVRERLMARRTLEGDIFLIEGVIEDATRISASSIAPSERESIVEAIAANEDLDSVLHRIVAIAEEKLSGALCAVYAVSGGSLHLHAAPSLPCAVASKLRELASDQEGISAQCLEMKEPIVIGDLAYHPSCSGFRETAERFGVVSCTAVPVRSRNHDVIGCIEVYRRTHYGPGCSELEFLAEIARLAAIAINRDISSEMETVRSADPLTHLPGRAAFEDALRGAVASARRENKMLAVYWVDVDRFRTVNEHLGHGAGDQLVRLIAHRMRDVLPRTAHIARAGGDEFAAYIPQLASEDEAMSWADHLVACFRQPYRIGGMEVTVTCSIGVSVYPKDGSDAATLLRCADASMQQAKSSGKDTFQRLQDEAVAGTIRRFELENELRHACDRNEFELLYQPQIAVDQAVTGMEALIRWNHPGRGQISPLEFLDIAEETGLIHRIGEWVLRESCLQAERWRRDGMPALRLAVNVSASQVYRSDLASLVRLILDKTGIAPSDLELELTESVLMYDLEEAARRIGAIRALGVSVAIDDFGTGYSSLGYLCHLPVDTLKIDKSFMADIGTHGGSALIRAVTNLARDLGLRLVAEGVETKDQLNLLLSMGVKEMQGFLFARPMSAGRVQELLRGARPLLL